MANSLVHYTCCLIILTIFIDRGDGRWKKKDRENLQQDIELFKKIADKIEYEIETFYDEYPDEGLLRNIFDKIHNKYAQNTLRHVETSNQIEQHEIKPDMPSSGNNKTNILYRNLPTQTVPGAYKSNAETSRKYFYFNKNNSWPKFDDILLAMGKRYDWKNDRWIKVKEKLKKNGSDKTSDNKHVEFHEKHNFYYRIVKLKRSKNRKNIVVAVSAVR